jgi:hypothetical protein
LSEHPARPGRLASIAGLAVLPALAGVAMAAGAPQIVGITSVVLNDVRISSASAPQPRRAALRERVALADQVQTGPRSQLQLMLLDKSVFSVGANARLTIDRYVYDPNLGRSFSATVAKGAFRFMSGQPDRRGNSSINTPVAAIGIRGTIVDGVVGKDAIEIAKHERGIPGTIKGDAETASLIVLRGPGPQTQGNMLPGAISVSAGGKTVELGRPMLATYVPARGAAPVEPFVISLAGLARITALTFPAIQARRAPRSPVQIHIGIPLPGFGGQDRGNTDMPNPSPRGKGQ